MCWCFGKYDAAKYNLRVLGQIKDISFKKYIQFKLCYRDTTFHYTTRPLSMFHSGMKSTGKRVREVLHIFKRVIVRGLLCCMLSQLSFSIPVSATWSLSPPQKGKAVLYSLHPHIQVLKLGHVSCLSERKYGIFSTGSIDSLLTLPKRKGSFFSHLFMCFYFSLSLGDLDWTVSASQRIRSVLCFWVVLICWSISALVRSTVN